MDGPHPPYWEDGRYRGPEHTPAPSFNGEHREQYNERSRETEEPPKKVAKMEEVEQKREEVEERGDESQIDLDTRIAMLLQNKDSSVPSFLSMGLGSDEEEEGDDTEPSTEATVEEENSAAPPPPQPPSADQVDSKPPPPQKEDEGSSSEEEEQEEPPLSTPPSPFLSKEHYLLWHKRSQEERREAARKEREQNRLSLSKIKSRLSTDTAMEAAKPNGCNSDDDRMSVSSLSSVENEVGGPLTLEALAQGLQEQQERESRPASPTMDEVLTHHQATLNGVLAVVIEELMRTLKKDFMKRMIETTAFKTYETWWDDNLDAYNKKENKKEGKEFVKEKVTTFSSLFTGKDNFRDSLGLRGLSSMPSFRKIKKIKPPTPPNEEDDSQDIPSDDLAKAKEEKEKEEEGVNKKALLESSDSDTSIEDTAILKGKKDKKSKPTQSNAKRKAVWADDSSSSDEKESSEDEGEEEASEEEEEDESDKSSSSSSSSEEESSEEEESSSNEEEEEEKCKEVQAVVISTKEKEEVVVSSEEEPEPMELDSEGEELKRLCEETLSDFSGSPTTPTSPHRDDTPVPKEMVEGGEEGLGVKAAEESMEVDVEKEVVSLPAHEEAAKKEEEPADEPMEVDQSSRVSGLLECCIPYYIVCFFLF